MDGRYLYVSYFCLIIKMQHMPPQKLPRTLIRENEEIQKTREENKPFIIPPHRNNEDEHFPVISPTHS